MNDDPTRRRMTDAELDQAVAAWLPAIAPLPPMQVADLLDYFTRQTRGLQIDLWTFRDAVDAHLTGARHDAGVAALGMLAELYDAATNTVQNLADELGIPISVSL